VPPLLTVHRVRRVLLVVDHPLRAVHVVDALPELAVRLVVAALLVAAPGAAMLHARPPPPQGPPMPVNPLLAATDVPPIPEAVRWAASYDGRHGELINLAQAVPGTPPPAELLARLGAAAASPEASRYGPITGDEALRAALAADVNAAYGGDVTPADIAITTGCNQAFFVAMLALAGAGDEVILPVPWYFNHKMTLDMLGIVARPLPCLAQHGFVPRMEDARALLNGRTRALVLVTPNNPTGATYPPDALAAFRDMAREAGIALVIDETYRDFLPEGQARAHGLFAASGWREGVMQLYSFSKAYAVPGHRLGSIVAAPEMIGEIAKVLDTLQICAPRAAQIAMAWAVEGIRHWRAATRADINARIALFRAAIDACPGWSISAIGAYFAFVRHPFGASGTQVAERLAREVGVVALPGSFFGPGQESHLRFAFANVEASKLAQVGERVRMLGG
jgi:aspartate/methionine/tyrosine aminotransferase